MGQLKYIFVSGVEGCGHHGLNPVLVRALQESGADVVHNKRRLKRLFNWLWCHRHPLGLTRSVVRNLAERFFRHQRALAERSGRVRWIIEDNSFPAGTYRDMSHQWDLAEMREIVGPHADIYLLALYRHPIASTFSHPQFDGGMLAHAELLKRALHYVQGQLEQVDPNQLLVVRYEDLVQRPQRLAKALATHLGIEPAHVTTGFKELRPSKKDWRRDMPAEQQTTLEQIFNERTATGWAILSGSPSLAD